MKDIKIIKLKKRRAGGLPDAKKESLIKELSLLAEAAGYQVRREHLKQGLGWKVVSGSCRVNDSSIIFVDRKLSQSEQISFLVTKFMSLDIRPGAAQIAQLSGEAKRLLSVLNEIDSGLSINA